MVVTSELAMENYTCEIPRDGTAKGYESLAGDEGPLKRLELGQDYTGADVELEAPGDEAPFEEVIGTEDEPVVLEKATIQVLVRPTFYGVCTGVFGLSAGALGALLFVSLATGQLVSLQPTLVMGSLCCLGWLATSIAGVISWRK